MRALVVGATGTIGSAVADALAAKGHEVLRASRKGSALWTWFVVAFAFIIGGVIVAMVILSR